VVISIIALLMSILMPALSKVKEQAKAAICLSNLHQHGLAWKMYTGDYRGILVREIHGQWARLLEPYYVNRKLLTCPSAAKPVKPPAPGAGELRGDKNHPWVEWDQGDARPFISSYTYNQWCSHSTAGGRTERNLWKTINTRAAAYAPLMADGMRHGCTPVHSDDPPDYDGQGYYSDPSNVNEIRTVCQNRHSEAVNVLFMDFSTRRVGLKGLWLLRWHRDWPVPKSAPLPVWPRWMQHMTNP
jgi:prepilin-type processing-associated H-X9-DG protein